MWWNTYCPLCGLSRSRWAGCDDPFHTLARTPVRDRIRGDINEPQGGYLVGRQPQGSRGERRLPPMADDSRPVNPDTHQAVQ